MRALAKSLHVSVITVQKAYEDLQRDGFIETTVGRGSFVSARNRDFYQEEQQRRAEAHLEEAAGIGRQSGIPLEKAGGAIDTVLSGGTMMTEMALTVRGLCKAYPRFRLEDVSLNVPRGTVVGADRRKRRGQEHADQRGPGPGEKGCGRGKRAGKRDAGRGNARGRWAWYLTGTTFPTCFRPRSWGASLDVSIPPGTNRGMPRYWSGWGCRRIRN